VRKYAKSTEMLTKKTAKNTKSEKMKQKHRENAREQKSQNFKKNKHFEGKN
jgi:hypothetical protein